MPRSSLFVEGFRLLDGKLEEEAQKVDYTVGQMPVGGMVGGIIEGVD